MKKCVTSLFSTIWFQIMTKYFFIYQTFWGIFYTKYYTDFSVQFHENWEIGAPTYYYPNEDRKRSENSENMSVLLELSITISRYILSEKRSIFIYVFTISSVINNLQTSRFTLGCLSAWKNAFNFPGVQKWCILSAVVFQRDYLFHLSFWMSFLLGIKFQVDSCIFLVL